jgi:hypothetical protein
LFELLKSLDAQSWAAWIQAIGVIGSLWVVLYFSHRNEVQRRKDEARHTKRAITQLKTELGPIRHKLMGVETDPFKRKKIWLPSKMMRRSRDFHLLEHVGTNLNLLMDQLDSLNGSMAALRTELDPEQRLQAEAEIKEGLSSCHQQLDSILEEMKEKEKEIEIELSAKKPFVVRRVIDATQRLFGSRPSV